MMMMRGESPTTRCQECGNQSKKDCEYMRCRTCCKTRGFHCETHVKSTWIPLSLRRRPKQQHDNNQNPNPKRPKPFNFTSTSSSGMQNEEFPAETIMKATFKCVRMMSSTEDVVNQCAYQTCVNIGGHVFKGVLYDQGPYHHHHHHHHVDQDHDHQRNQTGCNTASS